MALDLQVFHDPSLLEEAETAEKNGTSTRFQKTILIIQKFKAEHKITGCIQLQPMVPKHAAPEIKCVDSRTFFRRLKKIGGSIYFDFVPHNCELCLEIPRVELQIQEINEGKVKV